VPRTWGQGPMIVFAIIGLVCLGLTFFYGFSASSNPDAALAAKGVKHAIQSYHVGVMYVITVMLGCLGFVMITRAVQAGWSTTVRRTAESVGVLLPLMIVLLVPYVFFPEKVWKWMDPAYSGDYLLQKKRFFLTEGFFWARLVLYVAVFSFLGWKMYSLSRAQDVSGDKTLTGKAQWWSMPGLLAYALLAAFMSFDLIMAMDFHWFSTMFGVYFFAGSILSGVALIILLTAIHRSGGRLKGLVTSEHYHDLGKLLNAFTIFWAYISFSQYFLIWYANIPEATAWFNLRKYNGWEYFGLTMMFGHFLLPFLILLFRGVKKKMALLALLAAWQLIMHAVDMFWQIRPTVYMTVSEAGQYMPGKLGLSWVDITGLLGPIGIFAAAVIWSIRRAPLIPVKDPRLVESLNHKNYV
jgi:hypothetical protein